MTILKLSTISKLVKYAFHHPFQICFPSSLSHVNSIALVRYIFHYPCCPLCIPFCPAMGKHWVHTLLNKRITPLTCILIATTVIPHQQHCAIDSDIDIDYNDSHSSFSAATTSLTRTSEDLSLSSPLLIVVLSFVYILIFLHCQGTYISKRTMQPTHK